MPPQAAAYQPDLILEQAVALHRAGQLQQAAGQYRKYLRLKPDRAEVWHTLGGVYFELDRKAAALEALEKAAALMPQHPDYLNDLGGLHLCLGHLREAEDYYRRVLAIDPDYRGAQYNLGLALFNQGKIADAIAEWQRLVEKQPDYAQAHFNLGKAYRAQGQMEPAIASFQRALSLKPDFARAHQELADCYRESHFLREAIAHYEKALENDPSNSVAAIGLADSLLQEGQSEAAIARLRQFLEAHPKAVPVCAELGRVLRDHGDLAEAEAAYLRALELQPGSPAGVLGLSSVRRFGAEDAPLIRRIAAMLDNPKLPEERRVAIHFALGKIHDDCKDYDRAFAHYQAGNRLRRKRIEYDRERHTSATTAIIEFFDRGRLEALSALGSDSELPVFIVGMPRSGTTLTEQILSSHPQAHGAGELLFFPSIVSALPKILKTRETFPACLAALDEATAHRIIESFLALLSRHSATALRVSDKLPGNYRYLGLIGALLPKARIVHCRRDPLDVCLSIYFQLFNDEHAYAWDLMDIAHQYREYVRLMMHWREVLPGRILDLDYDALVGAPDMHARRFIEFCGLEWDDRCLEFHRTERDVRTASVWQVRQPIYKASSRRWKRYEKYLEEVRAYFQAEGIL